MSNIYDSLLEDNANAAGTAAVTAVGPSPEKAAKSIKLGQASGVPASVVFLDPEAHEDQVKQGEAAALVRGNPTLQSYVLQDPLAASVSSDDFAKLDKFSRSAGMYSNIPAPTPTQIMESFSKRLDGVEAAVPEERETPFFGHPLLMGKRFLESFGAGFGKEFGDEPLGLTPGGERDIEVSQQGLFTEAWVRPTAAFFDGLMRGLSALTAGAGQAVSESLLGEQSGESRRMARDLKLLLDFGFMVEAPILPTALPQKLPPGTARTLADVARLDEALKDAIESATRERSPSSFHDFSMEIYGNETISIPAEAVVKTYEGTTPQAGDGILGFIPDLRQQLETAIAVGGDIEVRLADLFTHVDPAVWEKLLPDVRTRVDGPTLNEAVARAVEAEEAMPVLAEGETPPVGTVTPEAAIGTEEIPEVVVEIPPELTRAYEEANTKYYNLLGDRPAEEIYTDPTLAVAAKELFNADNAISAFKFDQFYKTVADQVGDKYRAERDVQARKVDDERVEAIGIAGVDRRVNIYRKDDGAFVMALSPNAPVPTEFVKVVRNEEVAGAFERATQAAREETVLPEGVVSIDQKAVQEFEASAAPLADVTRGRVGESTVVALPAKGAKAVPEAAIGSVEIPEVVVPRSLADTVAETVAPEIATVITEGPETVVAVASLVRDQVFIAPTHFEATDLAASKLRVPLDQILKETPLEHINSFVTSKGRLVGRKEAAELTRAAEPEKTPFIEDAISERIGTKTAEQIAAEKAFVETLQDKTVEIRPDGQILIKSTEPAKPVGMAPSESVAAIPEPPVPPNHVRFYHGGGAASRAIEGTELDARFITPSRAYAEGYARQSPDGEVFYVDIPKNDPILADKVLQEGEPAGPSNPYVHFEAPPEIGRQLKPLRPIDTPQAQAVKAKKALFLDPLFVDAKAAGMTKEEFAAYSRKIQRIREDEATIARGKAEVEESRRTDEAYKAAGERLRPLVEQEFDARRDILAERTMKDAGVKLATDAEGLPRGMTSRDGIEPDVVATALGYSSGAELIEDLQALHSLRAGVEPAIFRKTFVDRATFRRVVEEQGAREDRIQAAIEDHVFSEPITRVLYDDLRVMRRQNEGETSAPLSFEELSSKAKESFEAEPVSRASKAAAFIRDVERAGREAYMALLKGKIKDAFKAKGQQVMAHLRAREAVEFQKTMARGKRIMKRFQKNKVSGLPQEYTDQIQGILARLGVPVKRNDLGEALAGRSLRDFVQDKEAIGRQIDVADFLYDGFQRIEDLDVSDYRALVDSLETLAYNGRMEFKIRRGQEITDFQAVRDEVVANIESLPRRFKRTKGTREAVRAKRYELDAWLTKPEFVIDDLDLQNPFGPLNETVMEVLTQAKHNEDALFLSAREKLENLAQPLDPHRIVPSPFINKITGAPYEFSRSDAIIMAMNLGNARNRELLVYTLMGAEIENRLKALTTDEFGMTVRSQLEKQMLAEGNDRVMKWLDATLTKEDWTFVQGIWDYFKWEKPQIDALYKRLSGISPDEVRPLPVQTKHGEFSGGYFPIIYDPVLVESTRRGDLSLFEDSYHRVTTPNSYTKKRTRVFRPLQVEHVASQLGLRIREGLHDLAFREAVMNAAKVLQDPKVRQAMKLHYGPEYTHFIDPWLQYVANRYNVEDRVNKWQSSVLRWSRQRIVPQVLGFNLNVILSPNVAPLFGEVLLHPLETAYALRHWGRSHSFVMEHSSELKNRFLNSDRDINEALSRRVGMETRSERIRAWGARVGMLIPVKIDTVLGELHWMEHYRRSRHKGLSHEQAVRVAEKEVRKSFGAHSRVDIAPAFRGSESMKLLTIFGGFLNLIYNRQRDIIGTSSRALRRYKKGDHAGAQRDFTKAFADSMAYVILTSAIGAIYAPQLITDDLGETVVGLLGSQAIATIPVLRDLANIFTGFPARPSPLLQAIQGVGKAGEDAIDLLMGEEPSSRWVQHALNVPGYWLGLPTGQIAKTSQFIWNWTTNQDEPDTLGEFLRGVWRGATTEKRQKQLERGSRSSGGYLGAR